MSNKFNKKVNNKYTLASSMRSIDFKFYGEQLVYTYGTAEENLKIQEYLEQKKYLQSLYADNIKQNTLSADIQNMLNKLESDLAAYVASIVKPYEEKFYDTVKTYPATCFAIKHDKDTKSDDFFKPSIDKPHYHFCAKYSKPVKLGQIIIFDEQNLDSKYAVVCFNPEYDLNLAQNTVSSVKYWANDVLYFLHQTIKAELDGKYEYPRSSLYYDNMEHPAQQRLVKELLDKEYTRQHPEPKDDDGLCSCPEELKTREEAIAYARNLGKNLLPYDVTVFSDKMLLKQGVISICQKIYDAEVEKAFADLPYHNQRTSLYIYGQPNLGKNHATLSALKQLGYNLGDIYFISGSSRTSTWDGLKATHKVLVIDDNDAISSQDILSLTDNKKVRLYKRNKGIAPWCGELVVILSNKSFESWVNYDEEALSRFPEKIKKQAKIDYEAQKSRFTIYYCDEDGLHRKNSSTRGSYTSLLLSAGISISFSTYFNDSLRRYTDMKRLQKELRDSKVLVSLSEYLLNDAKFTLSQYKDFITDTFDKILIHLPLTFVHLSFLTTTEEFKDYEDYFKFAFPDLSFNTLLVLSQIASSKIAYQYPSDELLVSLKDEQDAYVYDLTMQDFLDKNSDILNDFSIIQED